MSTPLPAFRRPMRLATAVRALATLAFSTSLACKGAESVVQPVERQEPPNLVTLASDPGDWVGAGRTYTYTSATARLTVQANAGNGGAILRVDVVGDESWHGEFYVPGSPQFITGPVNGAMRYPGSGAAPGLSWIGEGRGCNTIVGNFVITRVAYTGTSLSAIEMSFTQRCEGAAQALRGTIRWSATAPTAAPGPQQIPTTLWSPPAGVVPATGNFAYLQSEPGDFIGGGTTTAYSTGINALSVRPTNIAVALGGYNGNFEAMTGVARLEVGYYPDLQRYPFHNPARGGLSWSGNGRGCNTLNGWFAIDRVTYTGSTLTGLTLRFEQRCEGTQPPLRGYIRWN